MENYYSSECNIQIVIALLKAYGIRKVIASPGRVSKKAKYPLVESDI